MMIRSSKQGFFVSLSGFALALIFLTFESKARTEDAPPPPPPIFAPETVDTLVAPGAPSDLPVNPSPTPLAVVPVQDENAPAAPQISDDQMIRNYMEIATQLYHAEDWEGVIRQTNQILERYPKRHLYWVRYFQALAQEHSNILLPAIDNYKKVREQAPRSTYGNAALFRQGLCELRAGQEQEAIYTLRDVIETHPRSEYRLQAYVHLGNLYRRMREWKAATTIYRDLAKVYPNTSWAYTSLMYLGEIYAQQNKNAIAIRIYDGVRQNEAVPINFRAQALMRIGDLYLGQKDWLEAINTYRSTIRDFHAVPGIAPLAEEKIGMATEGRRSDRLPYRVVRSGPGIKAAPADESYRLSKDNEIVPYEQ